MSRVYILLIVASAAVLAAGGLVVLSYSAEIDRARTVVISGGRIVSTTAGPIE